MKRILIISLLSLYFVLAKAQTFNCNSFCVTNIEIDSVTGEMLVTIYNGDTIHVNYPVVQVIDQNGDTIGNPDGLFYFFAHMPGATVVHSIPTTLSSLPAGFTAVVLLSELMNLTCSFNYPMNCFINPDCDDLTVEGIQVDSIAGTMDVTLFSNSGAWNGFVYCEMKVMRAVAPFDTLAESNCFCLWSPIHLNYQTYTLTSYVNNLPPVSEIKILFYCGTPICDSLHINPILNISAINANNTIQVYPNPADGVITIKSYKIIEEVKLYELTGKLLFTYEIKEKERKIDIHQLASGIYLMKIDGVNYKILKQ